MRFTESNSINEFGKLNHCILSSREHGDISADDADTLKFFLDLVKETLVTRTIGNA